MLSILDGTPSDGAGQILTFVKRMGPRYPGNTTKHHGTTTQEVLRALIERTDYVNNQEPCAETEAVAGLLRSALYLLEVRAARKRGVNIMFPTLAKFEQEPVSPKDGHIL